MEKDEEDVLKVCCTTTNLVNPFATTGECAYSTLVNLSSWVEASESVASDLLTAGTCGHACFVSFVYDRLTSNPPVKLFQEPLKQMNLGTFSVKKKVSAGRLGVTAAVLSADCSVFSRFAVIA